VLLPPTRLVDSAPKYDWTSPATDEDRHAGQAELAALGFEAVGERAVQHGVEHVPGAASISVMTRSTLLFSAHNQGKNCSIGATIAYCARQRAHGVQGLAGCVRDDMQVKEIPGRAA